ncbi:hypothetical protein [Clostridium folliculivorans]|uniref:Uncharacterized protein n=1 Tax=Clostridium folliculivorans TaxID=2886038 RepID=A0A9W5Y2U6_9CLOT|nr:hypothetical protein [Clostridium folliculivorans]GKU25564.1 hypothetical protein CFOLD11_23900 [Clostridium folliculivorans]GKU28586.1 hypothetical protein CFB3_06920 [Clostridium folliculivorans]
MKYGLDIENKVVSSYVNKRLIRNGHSVVNFQEDNNKLFGEVLFRKALLANQTRVDLYINIENQQTEVDLVDIYVSKGEWILSFLLELREKMKSIGFDEVNIKDGASLYLCKKIKAPSLIIRIKSSTIDIGAKEFEKELADWLINIFS